MPLIFSLNNTFDSRGSFSPQKLDREISLSGKLKSVLYQLKIELDPPWRYLDNFGGAGANSCTEVILHQKVTIKFGLKSLCSLMWKRLGEK